MCAQGRGGGVREREGRLLYSEVSRTQQLHFDVSLNDDGMSDTDDYNDTEDGRVHHYRHQHHCHHRHHCEQ